MLRMMRPVAMILTILALPLGVNAQDEEPASSFAYGTYFECDINDEWLADAIVNVVFAPKYDAAVEDGTITAWGWLSHEVGGKWRRAIYHVAPTLEGVFDAADAIGEQIDETNAQASSKFGEICSSHDDYIWSTGNGSGGPGSADVALVSAKAGVSVYMACDMSRESRADEIVASFAPVYDAQVEAGNLAGWGWLTHVVGGEYRRLLNMRGADHKSVMVAWGAIIGELTENHGEALTEFSEICGSHQDYLWNIR